jgi:hypothetical protein
MHNVYTLHTFIIFLLHGSVSLTIFRENIWALYLKPDIIMKLLLIHKNFVLLTVHLDTSV